MIVAEHGGGGAESPRELFGISGLFWGQSCRVSCTTPASHGDSNEKPPAIAGGFPIHPIGFEPITFGSVDRVTPVATSDGIGGCDDQRFLGVVPGVVNSADGPLAETPLPSATKPATSSVDLPTLLAALAALPIEQRQALAVLLSGREGDKQPGD